MTNREKIIEELKTKNKNVAAYLMCPYVPSEYRVLRILASCSLLARDCAPCIQKWLDKEVR